jgi:sulfhydrogenase subunit beta (sulfur reductase)
MKTCVVLKDHLSDFISHLLQQYAVWGPVKDHDAFVYKQIHSPHEMALDFVKTTTPPKAIVFPQTETLLRFFKGKTMVVETPANPTKEIVLFGIRPCDAKGLRLLDSVFLDENEDSYYQGKRAMTITIGLTCIAPAVNCFCSSVGGNPDDPTGLDVLLTDLTDSYYLEILTEKGGELFKEFKGCAPATNEDLRKKNEVCLQARKKVKRQLPVEHIDTILDALFESPYWDSLAQRCIGCGICTFLCPTCHCFDIQDETAQNKGARVRIWDSCMYSEYTCQASGYNPRSATMHRLRNRIYHKFSYFPKNKKTFGCVGCGRCIDACPVHLDIIEILTTARKVKP